MVKRLEPGMVVLNGGAKGVDTMVLAAIRRHPFNVVHDLGTDWTKRVGAVTDGVTAIVFRPDWKRDGKAAGILRNLHMLDLRPEMVVCLHNGTSPGTRHVIEESRRRGLETVVIET